MQDGPVARDGCIVCCLRNKTARRTRVAGETTSGACVRRHHCHVLDSVASQRAYTTPVCLLGPVVARQGGPLVDKKRR